MEEMSKQPQLDKKSLLNYLLEQNIFQSQHKLEDNILFVQQFKHGQSNPTFLLKLGNESMVLRKKPAGILLKGAHLIEREFSIIQFLHSRQFPVPQPIHYCKDQSVIGQEFYLMTYMDGRIFTDVTLQDCTPQERNLLYKEMAQVLASLHIIDFSDSQIIDKNSQHNLNHNQRSIQEYYQKHLHIWERNLHQSKSQYIQNLIQQIKVNITPTFIQKEEKTQNYLHKNCIVHGDYRLDNIVFDKKEATIIAVLDWELWTIGPGISDLASNTLGYYFNQSEINISGLAGSDFGATGLPTQEFYIYQYLKQVKLGLKLQVQKQQQNQNQNFDQTKIQVKVPQFELKFCQGFQAFKMAGILQGVFDRSIQGNASNVNARQYGTLASGMAELGESLINQSIELRERDFQSIIKNRLQTSDTIIFNQQLSPLFWSKKYKLVKFMNKFIYPLEFMYNNQSSKNKFLQKVQKLKEKAKKHQLFNLFLPSISQLTNLEYAFLCEIMGKSEVGPEIFNCQAPDTGNMEVLHLFGNEEQKQQYLEPLLQGTIKSAFAMTEKGAPSSDALNIQTTIDINPDKPAFFIINGRKWFISNAGHPALQFFIVMCLDLSKQRMQAPKHNQYTMVIVPKDTHGVTIIRPMQVFGFAHLPHGHMQVHFQNVSVHKDNIILGNGRGFEIAQGRLGPGRIHHCMRTIGLSERILEATIDRSKRRKVFGKFLSQNDHTQQIIGQCRVQLDAARLLVLKTAVLIDLHGSKLAKNDVSKIKALVPLMAQNIADQAIQIFGAEGLSQDHFLSSAFASIRALRLADGPDEVHFQQIARFEIQKIQSKL